MAATNGPTQAVLSAPIDITLGVERVRLPGDEAMGLVGASVLLEAAPGLWVGPALYGAASGHRGGLFTWGAELQYRWPLAPRWQLVGGLYAGGGGGAAAPVGGGLMLRPHLDVMHRFDGWALGVSASRVDFPSGDIASNQFGLVASFNDSFRFTAPGTGLRSARFDGPAGLGLSHLALTAGHYAAVAGHGAFSTVGVQAEWPLQGPLSATAQAAGAAHGSADGYAEFGAGLLALWPAGDARLRWGLHGSVGMGGGGGVASGGGALARLALVGRLRLTPDWTIDLQAGRVQAFSGDFRTGYVGVSLGTDFGHPGADTAAQSALLHDTEWSLGVESYARAARKTGGDAGLSAVSLDVRRMLDEHLYVVGRAVSAFSGGAGAYSVGLVGAGAALPLGAGGRWRAGAELTAGAAGGGGVASEGGAVLEPLAWTSVASGRFSRLRLSLGWVKSVRGELSSPVAGLAWSTAFGTP
jgi:hypothetical protein